MRRAPLFAGLAGAAAAAALAAVVLTGHAPASAGRAVTVADAPATDQRYGIIRLDTVTHQWGVLDTAAFKPFGLTTVSCSATTGVLTVGMEPLGTIGTFTVDEDEGYAGRVDAGASIVAGALQIMFRVPATG